MLSALFRHMAPSGAGRGESGQVSIMLAAFSPVAIIMAALAVDTGAIAGQKREMQGLADMAAIAAAGDIDHAELAALTVLADNGLYASQLDKLGDDMPAREMLGHLEQWVSVETGYYSRDPGVDFEDRFTAGTRQVNAVRVSLNDRPHQFFSPFDRDKKKLVTTGIAAVSSEAAISVGSRLLSLNDGILNQVLGGLTGTELDLSVMDYESLVDANVDVLTTFEALATNLDLEAVTYEDVLDFDVTLSDLALAMADASDGSARVRSVLLEFAGQRGMDDVTVPLSALFSLGSIARTELGSPDSADLGLEVEAMQMLTTSAMAANGENQIDLALGAGVPGLVEANVSLLVGERPQSTTWFAFEQPASGLVSTAQTRLFIEAAVSGGPLLGHDLVRLPLYIELASADARVTNVVCERRNRQPQRVDVAVKPGILAVRIADLDGGLDEMTGAQRFRPAQIVKASKLSISAVAASELASSRAETLRFHRNDIGSGNPKTAETRDPVSTAIESAISNLDYDIQLGRLSLSSPRLLEPVVARILGQAVDPVDDILFNLTTALGIGLGEADVWVHAARCHRSVLVQ